MSWDSEERRKFVRIKFPCEIILHDPQKHRISTYTENISAGGLRIITKEKIKISSVVSLDIYGIKKEPVVCEGKVIWIFTRKNPYHKDAFFDVGIEFCQINKRDVNKIKNLVSSIVNDKK